jgi:hypothetical protein
MNQLDMYEGIKLRDFGIKTAEDNANSKIDNWSNDAYEFLKTYCITAKEFMAEEVRVCSLGKIERPPNDRAWGAIIVRAVKEGLIKRKGYQCVQNSKAHRTPATLWEVIK